MSVFNIVLTAAAAVALLSILVAARYLIKIVGKLRSLRGVTSGIASRLVRVEGEVARSLSGLRSTFEKQGEFTKRLEAHFDQLNSRLDGLDSRMGGVNSNVEEVGSRLESVATDLRSRVAAADVRIQGVISRTDNEQMSRASALQERVETVMREVEVSLAAIAGDEESVIARIDNLSRLLTGQMSSFASETDALTAGSEEIDGQLEQSPLDRSESTLDDVQIRDEKSKTHLRRLGAIQKQLTNVGKFASALEKVQSQVTATRSKLSRVEDLVKTVRKSVNEALAVTPDFDDDGNLRRLVLRGEMANELGKHNDGKALGKNAWDRTLYQAKAVENVLSFSQLDVPLYFYGSSTKTIDILGEWNRQFRDVAGEIRATGTTYLMHDRLFTLWQAVHNVAASGAPMIEVGVWRGGSCRFLAEAQRHFAKHGKIYACDTFAGHASVTPGVDARHEVGDFGNADYEEVKTTLSPYPEIEIVRGDIAETAAQISAPAIALIHIDVDVYSPTKFVLEHFAKRLDSNGLIVVDDYGFTSCPGVKAATDEFLAANASLQMFHLFNTGQAVLIRRGEAPISYSNVPRSRETSS